MKIKYTKGKNRVSLIFNERSEAVKIQKIRDLDSRPFIGLLRRNPVNVGVRIYRGYAESTIKRKESDPNYDHIKEFRPYFYRFEVAPRRLKKTFPNIKNWAANMVENQLDEFQEKYSEEEEEGSGLFNLRAIHIIFYYE